MRNDNNTRMRSTGEDSARDSRGWEWRSDKGGVPRMAADSAAIRREQASEIQRETRGKLSRTQALDASTKMGNPAAGRKK